MKYTILCYPKCSTCRKAVQWMDDNGIQYEYRHIGEENPSFAELKEWVIRSGQPVRKFFNTSGLVYKELNLKDKLPGMTEEEQLTLLASNGMLVKRPLVVGKDKVLVGFKADQWEGLK